MSRVVKSTLVIQNKNWILKKNINLLKNKEKVPVNFFIIDDDERLFKHSLKIISKRNKNLNF